MSGCLSFLAKIGWYLIWTILVSFIYVNGLNENDEFIWFDSLVKNIIASVIFFGPPVYFIWSIRKMIFNFFWIVYGINYLILALGLIFIFFDKENEDEYLFLKAIGLFVLMSIPIFLKIRKNLIAEVNKKHNINKNSKWIARNSLHDLFVGREVHLILNPNYKETAKDISERVTEENFIKNLKIIHNNKYEYLEKAWDGSNKIILKCKKHNIEFMTNPKDAIKGIGCRKCEVEKIDNKTKTPDQEKIEKEMLDIIKSGFFDLQEGQRKIKSDTSKILSSVNIMMSEISKIQSLTENNTQSIENTISKILNTIDKNQDFNSIEEYIPVVKKWFKFWNRIEENTKTYMPGSEWLFDNLKNAKANDFSPFVLYYCRALENELLNKIFIGFHDHVNKINKKEFDNLFTWNRDNLSEKKVKEYEIFFNFLKNNIQKNRKKYTLGEMRLILNLLPNSQNKKGSNRFNRSPLLKKLSEYISDKIGEFEAETIKQLENLINNYRNKSAHVDEIKEKEALIFYKDFKVLMNKLIGKFEDV